MCFEKPRLMWLFETHVASACYEKNIRVEIIIR